VLPYPGQLERGDKGMDVRVLQRQLRRRALPTNPVVDGAFGKATERAVKEFEKRQGLGVDGVVGKKVWDILF
jgi:peptidoglycan L-alanyl-D-glutamate endopeptidase CwlK